MDEFVYSSGNNDNPSDIFTTLFQANRVNRGYNSRQIYSRVHDAVAGPLCTLINATLEPAVFAETFAAEQQMSLEEAIATLLPPPLPLAAP